MAGRKNKQHELVFKTWGGKREGAGRPPRRKFSSEPHKKRPALKASEPLHVVLRVVPSVGALRLRHMYRAMRQATLTAAKREDCRIVHFSIQKNHVHLIVEGESRTALAKGMQGFQISAAKLLNAELTRRTGMRRTGTVFGDRYHARSLKTPKEVRNAIAYVLNNWRRHNEHRADHAKAWRIDPYSSALSFDGWKELEHGRFVDVPPTYEPVIVWAPRTWLLREGWRRHGLIRFDEVPGPGEKPQYA